MVHKPRDREQLRHAEECTVLAYYDFRIRSGKIRPPLWNRTDGPIINLQQETLPIRVISLAYTSELIAAERMERVHNPHKTRRCERSTRILA